MLHGKYGDIMDSLKNIFKNKNVLVTGHTGFKGSWMSIWLCALGAKVIGYSLFPNTPKDNFVLSGISNDIVNINDDIRNEQALLTSFKNLRPEIVFHFAAQPIVSISYDNPIDTYSTNVMGTLNLLECVRKTDSVKAVVIITTDKCYENKEWIWGYRENDPLGGYDPYSSSKAAVEIAVSSYRSSFFNPDNFEKHGVALSTVRAGNVIGGGDWSKDRLIPDCIRALENHEKIKVRNPASVRPWQHVLEPLYGYLLLTAKMLEDGRKYSEAFNFGPDSAQRVTVEDIVEKIIQLYGHGEVEYNINKDINKHETNELYLDCSKARSILDWKPKLSINTAIELTMEWYKNYNTQKVMDICLKQISEYVNSPPKLGATGFFNP